VRVQLYNMERFAKTVDCEYVNYINEVKREKKVIYFEPEQQNKAVKVAKTSSLGRRGTFIS
jgi:hypothetical protein